MVPPGIGSLKNAPLLRDFSRAYGRAVGLPVQFHTPGEFAIAQDPLMPAFCQMMALKRKTCEQCLAAHLALQDSNGLRALTGVCFAGLTSSAVPVRRGGAVLGYLHTGHAYVDRPSQACGEPGRGCLLPGRSGGIRPRRCAGACRMTRRLGAMEYEGAVGLLAVFASQLAEVYTGGSEATNYPALDHSIRKIREDVSRQWTLTSLARQAGMHPAYFSEKFHAHTGRTLTAFLAGLRVDRARHLLTYTALPVSEIAFASGFRSLSQFNRVYKKLTGHVPGADRGEAA